MIATLLVRIGCSLILSFTVPGTKVAAFPLHNGEWFLIVCVVLLSL
jgi:hypothetical protein